MGTYDATVSMLQKLPEADLLKVKEYISRLFMIASGKGESVETDPFRPLSEDEIYEQLALSRQHVDEGKVMPAKQVASNVKAKYGL